jgi:uncharacterized protein
VLAYERRVKITSGVHMVNILLYILLGVGAGILSGVVGIGGGILIVPALVFLFGFSQQQAQGTTLALLVPPIGILAAWTYYQYGFVNIRVAAFIAIGFILGSLFGARFAVGISNTMLEKIFGVTIILIGLKMVVGK